MTVRKAEFVLLYVALPVALLAVRWLWRPFPVLVVLWAAALPAGVWLAARRGWGRRQFLGMALTNRQWRGVAARLALAAAVLTGGIWMVAPEAWLALPRERPGVWAVVMCCYPLLSVYPQGILYRALYYERYADLFGSEGVRLTVGAAVFSLAHLVFANGWALALTLVGGVLFNRTYRRTGSLVAAGLEHAVCGQIAFTVGWGTFLYHGTQQLAERL